MASTITGGLKTANQAFRTTSSGIQLGRMLFDPTVQMNVSPAMIANLLEKAGVAVPKGTKIGADVAQILMAGGSIASNIETAASIGSYINPTTAIIKAAEDIFVLLGIMPADSPVCQIIDTGLDLTMVIASEGLNVMADIALALDVIKQVFNFFPPDLTGQYQDYATNLAAQKLYSQIQAREQKAQAGAAVDFVNYQRGNIGLLDLVENVAKDAPDLFSNYFPEIGYFLPPQAFGQIEFQATVNIHKEQKMGLFNLGTKSYDLTGVARRELETLVAKPDMISDATFQRFVGSPLAPYVHAQFARLDSDLFPSGGMQGGGPAPHPKAVSRILPQDWAVLSLFPPYSSNILPGLDIRPILGSLGLTPHDLGYDIMAGEIESGFYGVKPYLTSSSVEFYNSHPSQPAHSGITINGVDYFTPGQILAQKVDLSARQKAYADDQAKALRQANANSSETKQVEMWDRSGNIRALLGNPRASNIIREFGVMPNVPQEFWDLSGSSYTIDVAKNQYTAESQKYQFLNSFNLQYRNIQNLWSALAIYEQMKASRFFNPRNKIPYSMSDLENRHQQLQFKSVARRMNFQAKKNIAGFFGVKSDQLKMNPGKNGQIASIVVN